MGCSVAFKNLASRNFPPFGELEILLVGSPVLSQGPRGTCQFSGARSNCRITLLPARLSAVPIAQLSLRAAPTHTPLSWEDIVAPKGARRLMPLCQDRAPDLHQA